MTAEASGGGDRGIAGLRLREADVVEEVAHRDRKDHHRRGGPGDQSSNGQVHENHSDRYGDDRMEVERKVGGQMIDDLQTRR